MKAGDKVLLREDFDPWALEDENRSITVKAGTVGVVKDVELSPSLPSIRRGTVLVDFQGVQYTRYVFPPQVQRLLKMVQRLLKLVGMREGGTGELMVGMREGGTGERCVLPGTCCSSSLR